MIAAVTLAQAVQWWRLAARQGSSQAAYNLGFLYSQESGGTYGGGNADAAAAPDCVQQDFAEALKWYQEAAAAGNAGAEYNLGVMYEQGDGVTDCHLDVGCVACIFELTN